MSFKVIEEYVNPSTKVPLWEGKDGNLYESGVHRRIAYENHDGIYDFVTSRRESGERLYFDGFYKVGGRKTLTIENLQAAWQEEGGLKELLQSMGDISGKRILLLGNGISLKELYFLWLGARCVYTDLSLEAVKRVKAVFDRSELRGRGLDQIEFHAVDACQLPFPDESFDIVYGCVFVHHISELDKLFAEITRCLKLGGICRFLDTAYSPLWQCLKNTVLRRLQLYTHRKHGISPADLIATKRGGYKREELERIKYAYEFREMLYLRLAFFEYLLQRGTLKLGGRWLRKLKPMMRALDSFLDRTVSLVQRHGIVLVWGFTK